MSPILLFTLLFTSAFGYLAGPDLGIVGTWEFVSAKVVSSDGSVLELTNRDLQSTKILNQTHFCVVTRNADGSFRHVNHGPYKLEGSLEFHAEVIPVEEALVKDDGLGHGSQVAPRV